MARIDRRNFLNYLWLPSGESLLRDVAL